MGRRGCRQSGAGGCCGGHSLSREGADADPWRSRQPQADGERLQADDEGPWHRHPLAPPLVSVAVRDLDLDRLGFRNLRECDVKHTVLVRGLDRGMAYIARKPEGPMNSAVMAFCAMNTRLLVLTPGGLVALGVDH